MDFLAHKHADIYRHSVRVAILADKLAQPIGCNATERSHLVIGCFLHDLGKAFIPSEILHARRKLTEQEWNIIRLHPIVGTEMLDKDPGLDSTILEVIRCHHERYDGTGYPDQLAGENIPLFARMCSVLDAFDSMMSDRPYRGRMTMREAKDELLLLGGTQFDSKIVEVFLGLSDTILDLYSQS
ncbi:MAG: HD domain-containing protein [Gorillibacterium sp.]|nr:HD domain-containing protein [Gorillibacterium sp.]